ncbi:hypothetical protein FSP39_001959 [Pinctada imbricata]|uniref:Golgi apparatus protein 1 n=1 Tax=Pinctada imbricata TaxID=66713 RepID=A0AA89BS13_PINIB|nr:hypothetical protein FSP39_001959 [Pinctada imbricata]
MEDVGRRVNYFCVTWTIFCFVQTFAQLGNQGHDVNMINKLNPMNQGGVPAGLPGRQGAPAHLGAGGGAGNGQGQGLPPRANPPVGTPNARLPPQHGKPGGKLVFKPAQFKLSETAECADDCQKFCNPKQYRNNFAMLDCLQSDVKIMNEISEDCQHFIWRYKVNLTRDDRFDYASQEVCSAELQQIKDCHNLKKGDGHIIPCLIENMDNVTGKCRTYLEKMASIVFSDYRLIYRFVDNCEKDINTLKCGRVGPVDEEEDFHSQGKTLECLEEHLQDLDNNCKKQVLRVAELQADDYHLDKRLFYACRDDREHFCEDVAAGEGRIFECLFKHKFEKGMSKKCQKMLTVRQQLIAQDVKVEKTFWAACKQDIHTQKCFLHPSMQDHTEDTRRAAVLLCLENALKKDESLSAQCIAEMSELRQSLMEDYQISPEIVANCGTEITKCGGGVKRGGETLHCLMAMAQPKHDKSQADHPPVSVLCMRALEDLMKEADPGSDWKIDRALHMACEPVVETACRDVPRGEAHILNCLMEKVDTDAMTDECEARLMEIQYFIARDFKLDAALYKNCHNDAVNLCSAPKDWIEQGTTHPDNSPLILPCLYRHMKHDDDDDDNNDRGLQHSDNSASTAKIFIQLRLDRQLFKKCKSDAADLCNAPKNWISSGEEKKEKQGHVLSCLYRHFKADKLDKKHHGKKVSKPCKHEIKRVMRQRAKRVELKPEIEENCVQDLGMHCSDSELYKPGQEIACLQDHLDDLSAACHEVISNYTEDEEEMLELDNILMKACTPMIDKFCDEVRMDDDAEAEDIMQCLIDNKHHPDMDDKCKAGIEHHQLISLKDFRFNHKFKEACKKSVLKYCRNKKTKYEVVSCLSEHVRNDTLMDEKHRIEKHCRKQLRVEALERGENIKFDPVLEEKCHTDIQKFCGDIEKGNAKIIRRNCTKTCHKLLFKREEEEAVVGDFKLHSACKQMIKKHCRNEEEEDMLGCLKRYKDDPNFDDKCRALIIKRQINQNTDYRLNPTLMKTCKMDIPKFCRDVVKTQKNDDDLEGKVVTCLRKQYAVNRLSRDCHDTIRDIIKDSALNYMEDAALAQACEKEIVRYCGEEHQWAMDSEANKGKSKNKVEMVVQTDGQGRVIECLKKKFKEEVITASECRQQIARINQEAEVDINVDPLLHMACQQDLYRFCGDQESGEGRKMACLLAEFEDHASRLKPDCLKLLKQRKELWELSAQVAPIEGFQQIYDQIASSPSKLYILGVICAVIGMIFIVGITCGRASKKIAKQNKMK